MSTPARLNKVEENEVDIMLDEIQRRIGNFIYRYAFILVPLAILVGLIAFIALCFVVCGVSATDSGVQYNAMEKII